MHILYNPKKSRVDDLSLSEKELDGIGIELRDRIRNFEGKINDLVYLLLKEKVFLRNRMCVINNVCLWASPMLYGRVLIDESIEFLRRDFGDSYRTGMILLKGYDHISILKENTASAVQLPPKFASFDISVSEKEFYELSILFNVARNNFNEILIKKGNKWDLLLAKEFFYTGNDQEGFHVFTQEMMDQLEGPDIKKYNPFCISDTRNQRLREINPQVIEDVKKKMQTKKSFFRKFKKKKIPEFKVTKSDFEKELIEDPLFKRLEAFNTINKFFEIERFFNEVIKKGKK
ncbi:hypothetical protein KY343_00925 [Candidatus Woesearchaeota archaeon]|nr:hypothetical protein [Candidatus Woesearchaeota archaeon]